jgi:hypothetical protein
MEQKTLFEETEKKLLTIKEASIWASNYLNSKITVSNISYLIQYGKIKKYGNGREVLVDIDELKHYYDSFSIEKKWQSKLGKDINWHLSFSEYKEAERTKHVHRLHPYKGKFIPQLVEYFLDSHTDEFKKEVYFRKGDIILDPFCGSGTTLVQANELGIHAIGIDVSFFNTLISNVKVEKHNITLIEDTIRKLNLKLKEFQNNKNNIPFEEHLLIELTKFNNRYFPTPEYKKKVSDGLINQNVYAKEKEKEFLTIYNELIQKYQIKITQDKNKTFLDKWFLDPVRKEIDFLTEEINKIDNIDAKNVLTLILSRTARSCRATTHADLATLKEPVSTTYYCKKHRKICKPIFSITKWWEYYSIDTINRLKEFDQLRTDTIQLCLTGDSRTMNIYKEVKKKNPIFAEMLLTQKIQGIFSSPPYIGLIDYHEQHAYAYDIFGFERKDELEIGPQFKKQSKEQKEAYIKDIAQVLINCKKYLNDNYDVFLVANDKFNLYPKIAELAGMKIIKEYKRPVLCRVEKDREKPYSESIFHLKAR